MQTQTLDTAIDAALPCGVHAARALNQRVASLRAAFDAVCASMPIEDPLQTPITGARIELDRFARDVQALVEWTLPSPVRPLECSLEEIGFAAVESLRHDRRERTLVSVESPAVRVVIDGSLASKSLSRVVDHGFASGATHADLRIEPRELGFVATASFEGTSTPEQSVAASLGGALVLRDLARLGARIDEDVDARRTTVEFTAKTASEGETR